MEERTMRWRGGAVALMTVALVAAACGGGTSSASPVASADGGGTTPPASSEPAPSASADGGQIGGVVTVIGTWGGSEQESFLAMVAPFEEQTGIDVQFTGTRDINTVLSTGVA